MRQPGHRFFFSAEEIEPLGPDKAAPSVHNTCTPTVLIAGIGNIFLGDDGFGVEVARLLASRELPEGVKVIDFGIRGFDLAYALMDGPGATILIDACPRGGEPGSVYVVAPDLGALDESESSQATADAHAMNPVSVLRMVKSMGGSPKRILLVGCEPMTLGPEEGQMGLSAVVEAAVEEAVTVTEALVKKILSGEWSWNANEQST
jgi:hydrogenase maturation protease